MLRLGACGSALVMTPALAGTAGASVPPACTTQAVAVMAGQQSFVAVRTAIQNDRRAIAADRAQLRSDQAAGDTVAVSEDAVTLSAADAQLRADQLVRARDVDQLQHERHRLQGCKRTIRRLARSKW
jgi:hypothetical protein